MRLIVGNDYYDNVLAYGHDDSLVFVRSKDNLYTNKEMALKGFHAPMVVLNIVAKGNKSSYHHSDNGQFTTYDHSMRQSIYHYVKPIKAIVCGKEYHGLHTTASLAKDRFFWSVDSFNEWLDDLGFENKHQWSWRGGAKLTDFMQTKEVSKQTLATLIDNNITILTYHYKSSNDTPWQVNGFNLREIEFYKAMDAFTIFQEIEMFIGGVLPRAGNPIVEITNNDVKIAKHGFDKFSFRKLKQK